MSEASGVPLVCQPVGYSNAREFITSCGSTQFFFRTGANSQWLSQYFESGNLSFGVNFLQHEGQVRFATHLRAIASCFSCETLNGFRMRSLAHIHDLVELYVFVSIFFGFFMRFENLFISVVVYRDIESGYIENYVDSVVHVS